MTEDSTAKHVGWGMAIGGGLGVSFGSALGAAMGNVALGIALGISLGAGMGLAVGAALGARYVTPKDICPKCGYSTKRLRSRKCPECGQELPANLAPKDEDGK